MKKNGWLLFVLIVLGMLAGTLVALWLAPLQGISFLTRTLDVDWSPAIDLHVFSLSLSIQFHFSLLSIIGALVALWLYRRL